MNRIVVWDPKGDFWEGSLVDETTERMLAARGAVLLPVDPLLFKRSGVGGYFKRAWGSGWPLDFSTSRMVCPVTLFVEVSHRILHWKARLIPDMSLVEKAKNGEKVSEGHLRMVGDSGQANAWRASVVPDSPPVTGKDLGRLDEYGGWTVSGRALVNPPQDAYYGFGIYGTLPGVRVAWVAASLMAS